MLLYGNSTEDKILSQTSKEHKFLINVFIIENDNEPSLSDIPLQFSPNFRSEYRIYILNDRKRYIK